MGYENRLMLASPVYADWESDLVVDAAREGMGGKGTVALFAETRTPASILSKIQKVLVRLEKHGTVNVGNRRLGPADVVPLRQLVSRINGAKKQIKYEVLVRLAAESGAPRPPSPATRDRRKARENRVFQKKTAK